MKHIFAWLLLIGLLAGIKPQAYGNPDIQGQSSGAITRGEYSPYKELNDWLLDSLKGEGANIKYGHFTFLLGIFTGGLFSNPFNGEAMRRAVSVWLNSTMTRGDRVRIVGYEHNVWCRSPLFTLSSTGKEREDIFSALPFMPEPHSKGGKNIEHVMLSLAGIGGRNPKGQSPIILLLSNGFSQNAGQMGAGEQYQKELLHAGYHPVKCQIFRFIVHGSIQDVYAFLAIPMDIHLAAVASARYPGFAAESWTPYAYKPVLGANTLGATGIMANDAQSRTGSPNDGTSVWTWAWFIFAAGITLIFGLFVARSKAIPETGRIKSYSDSSQNEPQQNQDELKKTLLEARRHAKSLDILSQDMAVTMANLDSIIPSAQEQGELRNEIASLQQQLKDWDDASRDFLDTVQRGISMPGIAQALRDTWKRAGMEFARQAARNGFDVIDPKAGEPFVEGLHRLLDGKKMPSPPVRIDHCVQWGYRRGSRVYSPAIVEVITPDSGEDKGETRL
jgi:hypothetical protein